MTVFFYISLIGLTFSFFLTLLPAIGVKNPFQRFLFLSIFLIYFIDPIFLFLIFPAIFLGNILYFINTLLRIPRFLNIILFALFAFLTPFVALLSFGLIFSGDLMYYYLSFPFALFWVYWLWTFIRKSRWIQSHLLISRLVAIVIAVLAPLSIWGYHYNPTTFGRTLTINVAGDYQTYFGKQILNVIKQGQDIFVLELDERFEDVESVIFTSIYREIDVYGGTTLHFDMLVNKTIPFSATATFYTEDDLRFSIPQSQEDDSLKERENYEGEERDFTDLNEKSNQKRIQKIDITYYLKNDIYKIK